MWSVECGMWRKEWRKECGMWNENSTEIKYSCIKPLVLEIISHSTLHIPHSTKKTPHSTRVEYVKHAKRYKNKYNGNI
jgi:hypothetical protein